jgi:CheY-like chemotaxis protein
LPFEALKAVAFPADGQLMPNNDTTVLVVDDDPLFTDLMAKAIHVFGCNAAVAHDGEDGLRLARALRPALVFCDLSMPGLGGVEVLRLLRDNPATSHIPRILMSGHVCPHLNGIPAHSFLAKPVAEDTIHRLLGAFIKSHSVPD